MTNRLMKQIIFGFFYLAVLFGVSFGVYFLVRPAPTCFDNRQNQGEEAVDCGGPCISCAIKNLEPFVLFGEPLIFEIDKDASVVFLQIKNSNSGYGAERFDYKLDFYDSRGEKIDSLTNQSFIYAGKIKTIIEAQVKIEASKVAKIDFSAGNTVWRSSADFVMPNLQSRAVKVEIIKDRDQAKVSGLVLNNNSVKLSQVNVGVLLNKFGNVSVSASKTVLKDLLPFEERAFTIFIPLLGQKIDTKATVLFVEGLR